jgi:predicted  nucleic acid-binding Zn-ribbon protein
MSIFRDKPERLYAEIADAQRELESCNLRVEAAEQELATYQQRRDGCKRDIDQLRARLAKVEAPLHGAK